MKHIKRNTQRNPNPVARRVQWRPRCCIASRKPRQPAQPACVKARAPENTRAAEEDAGR